MKKNLRNVVIALLLFLMPAILLGQAPNLGAASSFVVFTSAGAFNNTGPSILTGDVGSYTSSPVGLAVFPNPPAPGLVKNGSIYGPAPSPSLATLAQQAAVISAYGQLGTVPCGTTLVLPLAGQILTPGVYCYGAAATLNGEITLDGQGDPDALFIIKIGGAFATVGGSNVKLINSASPNNVYWQIGGEFNLVDGSAFRGTVVANGAINMLGTSTFVGRALSQAGAIAIAANVVTLGAPPAAPTITLTQPTCLVPTGTITVTSPTGIGMTYSIDGITYTNTTGIFPGLAPGSYNVTAMDSDGYVSPRTSVTINAAPVPLTGSATITTSILCNGSTATVTLTGAGGTAPLSYTFNGVTNGTGIFTGINAGLAYPWSISDAGGCGPVTGNVDVVQPLLLALTSAAVSSPILCNGGTATVTIVANGGTPPYSYTFNGQTNATGIFNGVLAGLAQPYSITDANNCGPVTGNVDVVQPLLLALTSAAVSSPILCNGGTATVTIVANGGTPPYSYTFNGQTNATGIFNGVLAGLAQPYSITDANNCGPVTGNVDIVQPLVLALTSAAVSSPILCNGGTATVTIVANGGTAPYSYTFNGQTNATGIFNGVLAGLAQPYSITDANNCGPVTGNVDVVQPLVLALTSAAVSSPILCNGGTATVTIVANGGTAPYSYTFNGQTNATGIFNGVLAGLAQPYSITDANNCGPVTGNVDVVQPLVLALTSAAVSSPILCNGGTATVTIVANGGTAPYSYTFNGQTNATGIFNGVLAGLAQPYSITDANNCGPVTGNVDVVQPLVLALTSAAVSSPILCNGGTATVTIVANGGTAPYSYTFNGQTNATGIFNGVLAGLAQPYSITDANNCGPVTGNVDIVQPLVLALTSAAVSSPILCNGGTATVTIVANGGTAPYSYTFNGQTNATGIFNGVLAGLAQPYSITDANNCGPVTGNVDVVQPALLMVSTTQIDVLCFGSSSASATALPQGGTAPYSYSWNTIPVQTTATANSLSSGNYIVTVTDNSGCMATANVSIQQPLVELMVSTTQIDALCFGSSSASATSLVQGGSAPYSYSWNTVPVQTTATASNLSSGNYIVTVTDNSGCIATANVSIQQPLAELMVSTTQVDVLCFGSSSASATAIPQGGTAPYSYSWNTIPVQTTATANNLSSGNYIVTVTDNSGCIATANVIINQPLLDLNVNPQQTNVLCFGESSGSATASPTGGTAPYTYLWNTIPEQTTATVNNLSAGTYTVQVMDSRGCMATANVNIVEPEPITGSANVTIVLNGSGGSTPLIFTLGNETNDTGIFTNVKPGVNYSWSITDGNNCNEVTGKVSLCELIIDMNIEQVNVLCFGNNTGSATVTATGGTGSYTYSWNTIPVQTTATASNLAAGIYTVTVTDIDGITASANVTITQPQELTGSAAIITPIQCNGETATVALTGLGGTAPYSYTFNGVTNQTGIFSGIPAGPGYNWSITDANNCGPVTGILPVLQPEVLTGNLISQTDVSTFGSNNGSVTIAGSGGTIPYRYKLGAGAYQDSGTFDLLFAGSYVVTIQDKNLCTFDIPVTIAQSPMLLGTITSQTNVPCFDGNTGSVIVAGSGGNAPYEYKLGEGAYQSSGSFNSLTAGIYTVTVRDATLSTFNVTVTITQPTSALTVSTVHTNVQCPGEATGTASAIVAGGTEPYSYSWNSTPVQTSATISGLVAGTYIVKVTDRNGCTAESPVTIVAEKQLPNAAFTSSLSELNTYSFVNTSTDAISYLWDFGDNQASASSDPIHIYAAPGTYTVKLTATNSCGSDIETQVVTVPELEFFNGFSPNGDGQNDDWNIPVLNYYPVNDVTIINRWGSEVWKGINYDNKTVVWTGKNMKGEDMPDGTYYYIINYNNTEKRGWVFIKR